MSWPDTNPAIASKYDGVPTFFMSKDGISPETVERHTAEKPFIGRQDSEHHCCFFNQWENHIPVSNDAIKLGQAHKNMNSFATHYL